MKVTSIINSEVNKGATWSMSSVELSDGQIVKIFNPVMVGDEVESYQKDNYTNWRIKKVQAGAVSGDAEKIINMLSKQVQEQGELLQTLLGRINDLELGKKLEKPDNLEVSSQVDDYNENPLNFM
jgi:hypothetical protein